MRRLRLAAPAQLPLDLLDGANGAGIWWRLSEPAQARVLALLAALIAKGVLMEEADSD